MQIIKKSIIWILTLEARLIINKYKPYIIAVTGSVGKTATKDAIFCALTGIGYIRKSEKSLNSEFGLPLTIIGVPSAWRSISGWIENIKIGFNLIIKKAKYPQILILEIGADHPNDIKKVVKWLVPDVSVITKVGDTPVHVEFFDSPEQVFEEKSALVRGLKKDGTAVLYADEPKIVNLGNEISKNGIKVTTFGTSDNSNIKGVDYQNIYEEIGGIKLPVGFSFSISNINKRDNTQAESYTNINDSEMKLIEIKGLIGNTFMYPILSAIAVAKVKGVDFDKSIESVKKYVAPKGRMNLISGINNSVIIDDSYNSSPDAVLAALNTLKNLECSSKKIVILGDMMELGSYSAQAHHNVGMKVVGIADVLVTVGPRAKTIAEQALISGMSQDKVMIYSNSIEAGKAVSPMVKAGDIVLVKGSQSVRMERITKMLMSDPSQADKLLVRQEKEWLERE